MKTTVAVLLLALAGCSYPVLGRYHPTRGQSPEVGKADSTACRLKAETETHAKPIVDAETELQEERALYTTCMNALGYTVAVPR
jgi:hypothetical protein